MSTVREHLEGEQSMFRALTLDPTKEHNGQAAAEELMRLLTGDEPNTERNSSTWPTTPPCSGTRPH